MFKNVFSLIAPITSHQLGKLSVKKTFTIEARTAGSRAEPSAAAAALTAAVRVDEVKSMRNEAERMRLYAKQSKDKMMMADTAGLKDRATRRLGELIDAHRKTVGLAKGVAEKRGLSNNPRFSLAEIGVDKNLAN